MKVKIEGDKKLISSLVREYIQRKFAFSFDIFKSSIRNVRIRVFDVNGPKGGEDKHCVANVKLSDGDSIVIHNQDSDLYRSIDVICQRAKHTISRFHSKKKKK